MEKGPTNPTKDHKALTSVLSANYVYVRPVLFYFFKKLLTYKETPYRSLWYVYV